MRDKRSLLHFAVLIIVAGGITVFVLGEARKAIAEIDALSEYPAWHARGEIAAGIDTGSWNTYRNDEFGFEVRYPNRLEVRDVTDRHKKFDPALQLLVELCDSEFREGCSGSSIHVYKGKFRYPSLGEDAYSIELRRNDVTYWMAGDRGILSTFKFIE